MANGNENGGFQFSPFTFVGEDTPKGKITIRGIKGEPDAFIAIDSLGNQTVIRKSEDFPKGIGISGDPQARAFLRSLRKQRKGFETRPEIASEVQREERSKIFEENLKRLSEDPFFTQQRQRQQELQRQQDELRQSFLDSLDPLRQAAAGQDSAVESQAQAEREALLRNIATQANLAQRGTFNPALARSSIQAQSQVGQNLAAQLAAARAQEQRQAQQALTQALGSAAGFDVSRLGQAQAGLGQAAGILGSQQQVGLQGLGQTLDFLTAQRQLELQQQAQDRSFFQNLLGIGLGGAGGLLSGAASLFS